MILFYLDSNSLSWSEWVRIYTDLTDGAKKRYWKRHETLNQLNKISVELFVEILL